MKLGVIMQRELLGHTIRQNHKTGLVCANDLHEVGNILRVESGLGAKQLGSYFNLDSTTELINELSFVEDKPIDEIHKSTRGKNGGTWVSLPLFVDMAMWYTPKLRARILQWVVDSLLENRDNSGDSYGEMMKALKLNFTREMTSNAPLIYIKIASKIASACKVGTRKDKWETASVNQLKLRDMIHSNVALIADLSANVGDCLNSAIRKALDKSLEIDV